MNTCKTCKHWRKEHSERKQDELIGSDDRYGYCWLISDKFRPVSQFYTWYYADLITREDFGCTEWAQC